MKTAVQTISQESSRPDSDLAIVPAVPVEVKLPHPTEHATRVPRGQTVRWRGGYKFSVNFTSGVFDSTSITADQEFEGYWYTRSLPVIGTSGNVTICTYNLSDADSPDVDPPPPNVIIVDNSGLKGSGEK
jgi:hypothetical protein